MLFFGRAKVLPFKMYQLLSRCSTSSIAICIFRTPVLRRRYSPMFAETTSTEISKPKGSELQKRKDPTMLEVSFVCVNTEYPLIVRTFRLRF